MLILFAAQENIRNT